MRSSFAAALLGGVLALLAAGCSDDSGGKPDAAWDAGADLPANPVPPDAGSDASVEVPPAPLLRLERPTDLPRPPNGRLPADLFPPAR